MSKVQGPERRVVHGKKGRKRRGRRRRRRKRRIKRRRRRRTIYLFIYYSCYFNDVISNSSKQQLMEGERPTKEQAVIALHQIFRIMIQACCINSLWLTHHSEISWCWTYTYSRSPSAP
jgi:hypothetical protein